MVPRGMAVAAMTPPYAQLHAAVLDHPIALRTGSDPYDTFAACLLDYQTHADDSLQLDTLAQRCGVRSAARGCPRDLVAAYTALAALARWRIAQLQAGHATEMTHG